MPGDTGARDSEVTALLCQIASGNELAFNDLCRRCGDMVRGYLARSGCRCSADRDDLTQEVFATIWRRRTRYQVLGSGTGYLRAIAGFALRRHRRQHRRLHGGATAGAQHMTCHNDALVAAMLQREAAEQVERALMRLPHEQQLALRLTHLGGLSSEEAARITGCSAMALRKRMARGLARLREMYRAVDMYA